MGGRPLVDLTNDEALELLSNAIIVQAVKDYRHACYTESAYKREVDKAFKAYKKALENLTRVSAEKQECKEFFTSAYFESLTPLSGRGLLKRINAEIRTELKKVGV